eukprot:TRINITY_DN9265_c0_g2_i2.p1 TRINITY_DN9265_c0_g2~~TRINITY_DN9265_c0_g2_i2.p1  ORF type:complete len:152 (+),score=1.91 TRINITY_DN9265_c0_g2_i2:236-691(+)
MSFKRIEAAITALFFHILQHSPILQSIIQSESSLATPTPASSNNYLYITSSWIWLRTAVCVINSLDLISNVIDNSLMWSTSLNCEMIITIDKTTRDLLRSARNFIEAYLIIQGRTNSYEHLPLPSSVKLPISYVYIYFNSLTNRFPKPNFR